MAAYSSKLTDCLTAEDSSPLGLSFYCLNRRDIVVLSEKYQIMEVRAMLPCYSFLLPPVEKHSGFNNGLPGFTFVFGFNFGIGYMSSCSGLGLTGVGIRVMWDRGWLVVVFCFGGEIGVDHAVGVTDGRGRWWGTRDLYACGKVEAIKRGVFRGLRTLEEGCLVCGGAYSAGVCCRARAVDLEQRVVLFLFLFSPGASKGGVVRTQ
ncbi:hypothetical protein GOBAR_AA12678 [Gossypium barbadense]|uniref:Uncharacterized protein n=1 Tax=Gossypium barbadense TaxID=3634 RepID=A0A2P5XXE8_GOSBA|nr:hypothetical protein GOBAR_AA12678 [Gossypium barbadense]